MSSEELNAVGASFAADYSDQGFWSKVGRVARKAGQKVLKPSLELYYAAADKDTPVWAKTVIYGALGYFISPLDLIPDVIPVIGYMDDAAVIAAAVVTVAAHIKEEHQIKATQICKRWLG
ncbi:MAG: DUF1232 domain-containing protein [Marinospirillum sp.]|nr:DUF1232 domain-containing protein [Marinospirillum sp.]